MGWFGPKSYLVNVGSQTTVACVGMVVTLPSSLTPGTTRGRTMARNRTFEESLLVVWVRAPGEDFTYAVPATRFSAHPELVLGGPTPLIERLAARP